MTKRNTIYTPGHVVSSLLMLLALAWLTVSTPFVYRAQQEQEKLAQQFPVSAEEDFNPFASTNEEKTESGGNTLSEEYLHHGHHVDHHASTVIKYYKCHLADEYLAYHPEAFSPPPEA